MGLGHGKGPFGGWCSGFRGWGSGIRKWGLGLGFGYHELLCRQQVPLSLRVGHRLQFGIFFLASMGLIDTVRPGSVLTAHLLQNVVTTPEDGSSGPKCIRKLVPGPSLYP